MNDVYYSGGYEYHIFNVNGSHEVKKYTDNDDDNDDNTYAELVFEGNYEDCLIFVKGICDRNI